MTYRYTRYVRLARATESRYGQLYSRHRTILSYGTGVPGIVGRRQMQCVSHQICTTTKGQRFILLILILYGVRRGAINSIIVSSSTAVVTYSYIPGYTAAVCTAVVEVEQAPSQESKCKRTQQQNRYCCTTAVVGRQGNLTFVSACLSSSPAAGIPGTIQVQYVQKQYEVSIGFTTDKITLMML